MRRTLFLVRFEVLHRPSLPCAISLAISLAIALVLVPLDSRAEVIGITWTGEGDGSSWADDGNWAPAEIPNNTTETQYSVFISSLEAVARARHRTPPALFSPQPFVQ